MTKIHKPKNYLPRIDQIWAVLSVDDLAQAGFELSRRIQPLLAGQDPNVQGAALADLVSLYFAGHCLDVRAQVIEHWFDVVRQLIEPSVQKIRAKHGGELPPGWQKQ